MRPRHLFGLLTLAVLCASPAFAQPPQSAAHVDPKAPCYRWPAVDMDGDGVFDRVDHCVNTPPGCTVDQWGCERDSDGDGVCDGVDQCPDTPAGVKVDKKGCPVGMPEAMNATPPATPPQPEQKETPKQEAPPTPPPSKAEEGLLTGVIRLDNVYFETAKATLLPESKTQLDELATALRKHPELKVEVGGHTDSRGTASYNQKLSQARADAVRSYLVDNGVDAGTITAVGYGESRLLVNPEKNDEDRARNRRVELRVLNPEALPKGIKIEK